MAGGVLVTLLALLMLTSCDIYEGLDPCPRGINLRFVFDYNMEYANAFPSKVDGYTLFIYDEQGHFLKSYSEEGDKLKEEDYRLQIDLPHGDYQLIAYGGMNGDKRSFQPIATPAEGSTIEDLQVTLLQSNKQSSALLHDFFYGALEVTVEGELYKDKTIHMMQNTNNLRVLLQHLDGTAIPMDQFEFSIVDDNTLFDAANRILPNGGITYTPWIKGETKNASSNAEEVHVSAGFAEFSTSRLWEPNKNRLIVRKVKDKSVVLDIPLNSYLLLLKSERFSKMGAQEFLDRESDWSLVFFLDSDYKWINTQIIVNGWTVRINDTEF